MGDMGDIFNDMKVCSQEKRCNNRLSSAELLRSRGVEFVSKNDGAHLIIDNRIDFWPGTGKWNFRGEAKYHRGVFKLLKRLKQAGL